MSVILGEKINFVYSLQDYDYDLPEDLIAQNPAEHRDHSRLLVLNREDGSISYRYFYELPELLKPSDVLVINNTEVIPARLYGKKQSGGHVEILILNYGSTARKESDGSMVCQCLLKASKRTKPGTKIFLDEEMSAEVLSYHEGFCDLKFYCSTNFETLLYRIGKMPLPPYIRRDNNSDDRQTYQTVYAEQKGAIAAPTAGLHFTHEILAQLKSAGITVVPITLHVGYGTFLPVRVSDIREHKMHSEYFSVSEASARAINYAKQNGQRVIAIGTTCMRTLEYASDADGRIRHGTGECDLFIYPGYRFKIADAMITNFHLPQSTLLMLVSAFAGRDQILNAYQQAIAAKYRFYSYGDAMLIG